ncbi:methyltransferase domain-containing protein [Streptomyces sp. L2]|uniref:methyltransferase domain-containing protein n=1 Tax=Streptomyces sp. L2 TaxID=2162665 RepID=UPI00101147DF
MVAGPAGAGGAAASTFDVLGGTYEETHGRIPELLASLDWLISRLPERAKVLDLGSGTGRPTAQRLAEAGHEVLGCDVSATMVDLARSRVPAARFEQVDLRELPDEPDGWDAVTAYFPLLQMSRADIAATVRRVGTWLKPGGLLALATIPADAEDFELTWMGQVCRASSFPAPAFLDLVREAGLHIAHARTSVFRPDFAAAGEEEHLFVHAVKPGGPDVPSHALAGPYPLPTSYRGPHALGQDGWLGMEARFERHDISVVADALAGNTRVLDIGGGTGAVVKEITARLGACTTVEPHLDRERSMRPLTRDGVTVVPGRAEDLPVPDNAVDAAVATWVLHYTDAPRRAVREMVRVVDTAHPEARIVLVQGAPDNELIDLWNRTCAPLTGQGRDHQGYLLTLAARELAAGGFTDISFTRAPVDVVFPENGPEAKAEAAAQALAEFWSTGDPAPARLREALLPLMREHFATGTDRFNDDGVLLVARPRPAL